MRRLLSLAVGLCACGADVVVPELGVRDAGAAERQPAAFDEPELGGRSEGSDAPSGEPSMVAEPDAGATAAIEQPGELDAGSRSEDWDADLGAERDAAEPDAGWFEGGEDAGEPDVADAGGEEDVTAPDAETPPDDTPYLERACDAETPCPAYSETDPPGDFCYSPDGSGAGTCMFFCTYHFVEDGKDKWRTPKDRFKECEMLGGQCYPIGKNVYCLPAGTDPECGDDPFCG